MVEKELKEAIKIMKKQSPSRNFVESVDIAINLRDINLQDPAKRFQLDVQLPNSVKKDIKICVLAEGSQLVEAQSAGAARVIDKEELESISREPKLAKKIAQQYDFFVASAPLMPLIGRNLGKYLGPRGKMPKPVPPTAPIEPLLQKYSATVQIRLRQSPVIHARIGTVDMENDALAENALTVVGNVESRLDKGENNIRSIIIKTTMGPPIKVK
ncbi:MAG: 50S ribosomal protein L1 [Candidatus Heimdallarchaeota archaeon]|nr:50S ribosomal protein L1 [Candidatus Heimdallarchaeota archaeon]MCK4955395.1 50S ribosomal protein L1 [Candidatus Heimdallarchaeota archaeon]